MNTWRKINLWACSLLAVGVTFFCGGCLPVIHSITPDFGEQGTQLLDVTLTGTGFDDGTTARPDVIIDGHYISGGPPPQPSPPPSGVAGYVASWTDSTITLKLFINGPGDPYPAYLGAHTIAVETKYGFSVVGTFYVTCQGCVPSPTLLSLTAQPENMRLVPGGQVTFLLTGTNLFDNNPQVQIDGSGVTPDPDPPLIQQTGCPNCLDYFYLPITAALNATPGIHDVWVTTAGGTSNHLQLTVDASTPPPSPSATPSPGATPNLRRITPTHMCKCGAFVNIKFEGSGFGTSIQPNVIFDNLNIGDGGSYPAYQANQDQVAVARVLIPDNIPDTSVAVRIQNNDTQAISEPQILFLDEKAPGTPLADFSYGAGVYQGGDEDAVIAGDIPPGTTGLIFSGVPGLTFSNIHWDILGLNVHVHANPSTPVTGDEATNLTITTPNGLTNSFAIRILPPP